jgi:hypothetical protein
MILSLQLLFFFLKKELKKRKFNSNLEENLWLEKPFETVNKKVPPKEKNFE